MPARAGFLAVLLVCLSGMPPAAGQAPGRDILALLRQMTLDEKISLVHGARDPKSLGQAGYWPGLPRLGIPPLRFADGPPGVNVNRDATALPAPVGLAATFNPEVARLYGVVLGREAKALGQDVFLAPYVNIVRDPLFRRNHTTLSEDPLLAARLGAEVTTGIQSQGVMAQVKHLAGYSGFDNVLIDERTLHEVYLPAFEAAVKAGVASVMCAYNMINGSWGCENGELQNDILRRQWGFKGFVTSDWGAVHSPGAITKGLDLEMPGREIAGRRGGVYFTEALKAAVESGAVPVSSIDQAVGRILYEMDRFGLLGRKPLARAAKINIGADAKSVQGIAEQSAVLLKNDGDALPLAAADLESLAVIGPTGGQLAAGFMGERAQGFEARLVAPLAALKRLVPRAKVVYSVGVDLTGVPIPDIKGPAALEPGAEYAWAGTLRALEGGDYTFMVQPATGGGAEGGGTISIDGRMVARTGGPGFGGSGVAAKKWSSLLPTTDGRDNGRGTAHLSAGDHRIEITAHSIGEAPLRRPVCLDDAGASPRGHRGRGCGRQDIEHGHGIRLVRDRGYVVAAGGPGRVDRKNRRGEFADDRGPEHGRPDRHALAGQGSRHPPDVVSGPGGRLGDSQYTAGPGEPQRQAAGDISCQDRGRSCPRRGASRALDGATASRGDGHGCECGRSHLLGRHRRRLSLV